MSRLTKLLELGYASPSQRKSILNKSSTKALFDDREIKALLQSEGSASTTLVQEEVYKTISEGAEPWKCMRDVLPIIKTDSYSVRIVKGETGQYADDLAEGAKVPIDTQTYDKEDITIKKIGTRPLITNEVIEDGLFDVVEMELKKAGARIENKLNRDALLEILTDTTAGNSDVDPTGTHIAVSDVAYGRGVVSASGYMPDTAVFHPTAEGYLLQDANFAYSAYYGSPEVLKSGKIPTFMGLKPYTLSVSTGSTGHVWDATDAANHYYAFIIDSSAHTYIAMRRDLTVEEYADPIHDIVGIACTMRYGVATIQPAAGVLFLSK